MCGSLRSSTAPRRTFWLESNFAASVLLFKRCTSSRSPLQRQAVRRPAACLLYVFGRRKEQNRYAPVRWTVGAPLDYSGPPQRGVPGGGKMIRGFANAPGTTRPWRVLLVLNVTRSHTHPRFCYSLYNCSDPPGIAGHRRCVMRRLKPIVAVAATLAAILGERWLRSKMHQLG